MNRTARGPVRTSERALAPDLARGLMLLLIVTSNTMFFVWDPAAIASTHVADTIARVAMAIGLDMRAYPLFAFLFGYGMVQLFRRQVAAGSDEPAAVRLLRRRSLWLLLFGFLHAALLLASDVIGAYGLISLVLGAFFLRRTDRTLRAWSVVGGVLLFAQLLCGVLLLLALQSGALPAGPAAAATFSAEASGAAEPNYLVAGLYRLATWGSLTGLTVFGVTAPLAMLLGIQAARHRILEEPGRHLRLLKRTALAGIAVGWLGGLPISLVYLGIWRLDEGQGLRELALLAVQWPTGPAGGIGYVALFALLAHRLAGRQGGWFRTGIVAIGRRSLSCYLTHSVLLGPILAAWGLGLGAYLSSATGMAYAAAAWFVTLVGALWLERTGRRGPAETVLRSLVYGRPAVREPAAATR